MKDGPVLLLDCDGPLAQFTEAFLVELQKVTGGRLHDVEEVDRWDIHEAPFFLERARTMKLSPNALRNMVYDRVTRPGFCRAIPVQPGAKEAVRRLKEIARIYIVTSPWTSSLTWAGERYAWLKHHFGISGGDVIQGSAKHLVRGDVFVDDKASTVHEWQKASPYGAGFLFDMHHNRLEPTRGAVRRAESWEEIIAEAKLRG